MTSAYSEILEDKASAKSNNKTEEKFLGLDSNPNARFKFFAELYVTRNFVEIIKYAERTASEDLSVSNSNFIVSHAYLALKNIENSDQFFGLAIKENLAQVLEQVIDLGKKEFLEEFKHYINKLIMLSHQNVDLWMIFGVIMVENNMLLPALQIFEQALMLSGGDNNQAKLYLAYINFRNQNYTLARKYCNEIIDDNSVKFEAFALAANMLIIEGKENEAQQIIDKIKVLNINNYFYYFLLHLYHKTRSCQADESIKFLQKAKELSPSSLFIRRELAETYLRNNNIDECGNELNKIIRINDSNLCDVENYLGLLNKYNVIGLGVSLLDKIEDRIEGNVRMLYYAAIFYLKAGNQKEKAKNYYDKFLISDAKESDKDYVQYLSHDLNDEYETAYKFFKKISSGENKRNLEIYSRTFNLFLAIDKIKEGIKHCEKGYEYFSDAKSREEIDYAMMILYAGNRQYKEAFEIAKRHTNSYNINFLSIKILLAETLNDEKELELLKNIPKIVRSYNIENFVACDKDKFNSGLKDYIKSDPSLEYAPIANATINGWHSKGNIANTDNQYMCLFLEAIQAAVERYIQDLKSEVTAEYPVRANIPENYKINYWSVVMEKGGHQQPHIHLDGWASGVYYIKIPGEVNEESKTGWLEVGRSTEELIPHLNIESSFIQPKEGKLVLFPSYMWHNTVPLTGDETRMCIAFDIINKEKKDE